MSYQVKIFWNLSSNKCPKKFFVIREETSTTLALLTVMPCHQAAKWPLAIIHPIRLLTHNFRYWSPLKFHIWHLTKKQHRGQARIMGTHLLWILLLYSKKARRAVDCIFLCAKWRTRSFLWHYPLRWILDQNVLKHIFIGYLIFFLCFSVTVVSHF